MPNPRYAKTGSTSIHASWTTAGKNTRQRQSRTCRVKSRHTPGGLACPCLPTLSPLTWLRPSTSRDRRPRQATGLVTKNPPSQPSPRHVNRLAAATLTMVMRREGSG